MVFVENAKEPGAKTASRPQSPEAFPSVPANPRRKRASAALQAHPLHKKWTFWALIHKAQKQAKQVKIGEVGSVEKFWCLMNSIEPPSSLKALSYSMFKDGLDPSDENACRDGGRWIACLPNDMVKGEVLDEMWLTTVLALVGEEVHDRGEYIAGVTVSTRAQYHTVSLWIDRSSHASILGKQFHRLLRKVASDVNVALGDFHYEDFCQGMFTLIIRAMVTPVLEDDMLECDSALECDSQEDSEPFAGLGTPAELAEDDGSGEEEEESMFILSVLKK